MSIRREILWPAVTIIVVAVVVILITATIIFSGFMDENISSAIETYSNVTDNAFNDLWGASKTSANLLAGDDEMQAALAGGDREAVLKRAQELQKQGEVGFVTITDADGDVLVRTHNTEKYGDSVAKQKNVAAALQGDEITTVEPGTEIKLSVRTGAPVYDSEGNIVGVVSAGYRLDDEGFVDSMKALTGAETTVFLGDERLSTTVTKPDGTRAVGTKADEKVSEQVLSGTPYEGKTKILDKEAYVKYIPLDDADGNTIGMLFVGEYTDIKTQAMVDFLWKAALISVVLIIVGSLLMRKRANRITVPIETMVGAANKLADGAIDVNVDVNTKDETKQLADAFNRMIGHTREQADVISRIAKGDLSAKIEVASDKDVIGHALQNMLEHNNNVFSQINTASVQVAGAAAHIADGAQALAQGSTEQASVVDQLSQSISDISSKSKENVELAVRAADLAKEIESHANAGSEQMGRMTQAVAEINDASSAISKVMKVIDDIAFQTNILALNAAVEAARAGAHGKGFAVVAEEVRTLAAKSAESAKDTGELIGNSIEKAKLGSRIAEETSKSFEEIVSGINESGRIISDISAQSEEQSEAISQVNKGIDQVAQVVQQNTATAEESAAASEEMSGQSNLLKELVSRFKLADTAHTPEAPVSHSAVPDSSNMGGFNSYENEAFEPYREEDDMDKY